LAEIIHTLDYVVERAILQPEYDLKILIVSTVVVLFVLYGIVRPSRNDSLPDPVVFYTIYCVYGFLWLYATVFSMKVAGFTQLWFPGFILIKNPNGLVVTAILFGIAVLLAPFAFRARKS
jgi:hypothetical protein